MKVLYTSRMNGKIDFIKESNAIEGIHREPTEAEIAEYDRFMALEKVTIGDLKKFVKVYQPDALLRNKYGLDVRVGGYYPPRGDNNMESWLNEILDDIGIQTAWKIHNRYESLHPFTDGNGRSGRMLWMWQMREAPLGFLHTFYYQTLSEGRA